MYRASARHLISLNDLTDQDLLQIVHRGYEHALGRADGCQTLHGKVVGTYFRKTSTRTRTAFSAAALRLGAHIISFGPEDLQVSTGETLSDTGRVLGGMLDAIVVRSAGDPRELQALAGQDRMPVINAMTADEHPTQALADLTTLLQRLGRLDHLRVVYFGEGNNTAAALALALTRFPGTELHLRVPAGYGLDPGTLIQAERQAREHHALFEQRHDLDELPTAVDAVYAARWETTGTVKADPAWRDRFCPFQVTTSLMALWPEAFFMHDLPAHRGEEVEADVLDGSRSIAFHQAVNKLHSAKAVLEWCLTTALQESAPTPALVP
jgi:ornithine carbamoyltransferase